MTQDGMPAETDVVVVGGGAAGLNGALMLARSRRDVTVIDGGEPRNAPAHEVHGLLARDGTPPLQLLRRGREEVRRYGGRVVDGAVARIEPGERFAVHLAGGGVLLARRVLVATGVVDVLPPVPGLAEHWGRDVVHCPYCHGWEVRDRAIGVLATGQAATHQALLFSRLSDDVVVLANGVELADAARLRAAGVRIVAGAVQQVLGDDGRITGVRLADGGTIPREVLVVATRLEPRADLLRPLGLRLEDLPGGAGRRLPVDAAGRTSFPGVWAAGNLADPVAQVGAAAAAGAMAGAAINADLVLADVDAAVAAAPS